MYYRVSKYFSSQFLNHFQLFDMIIKFCFSFKNTVFKGFFCGNGVHVLSFLCSYLKQCNIVYVKRTCLVCFFQS